MSHLPTTRAKLKRASHKHPCPVCEGDGCGIGDGITHCHRVESDRQNKIGAWIHVDEDARRRQSFIPKSEPPRALAPADRRHKIYTAMLDRLPLYAVHADQLSTRRRLSDTTIAAEGYASVPARSFAAPLVDGLAAEFDLTHVPGFFKRRDRWYLRFAGFEGFYIPIRDHQGRISALEIRRDTEESRRRYLLLSSAGEDFPLGASCGAPPHFARPWQVDQAVVITEGALKATVCAELLKQPVVGLVAVGTFGERFGWQLRNWFPRLERVGIAYDMEENDKTEKQKQRLKAAIEAAQLEATVFDWPPELGKGFDDYLIALGGDL
jgi:hypothetical protein